MLTDDCSMIHNFMHSLSVVKSKDIVLKYFGKSKSHPYK